MWSNLFSKSQTRLVQNTALIRATQCFWPLQVFNMVEMVQTYEMGLEKSQILPRYSQNIYQQRHD
jgi:hypothetical protein